MDFNIAVERIGFPLAVLLYENELPENLWQIITTEQCFQLLEHKNTSADVVEKAKAKALVILTHADFATAKVWYLASQRLRGYSFWKWHRQGYAKMKELASTFTEWRAISDIVSDEFKGHTYYSPESRDWHEREQRDIAQHLYPLASTREEWAYLSQFSGPHSFNLSKKRVVNFAGSLTKEQYLEVAKQLLGDNPTEDEVLRLGHRFPPQHPHYTRRLEALAATGEAKNDLYLLTRLYKELSGFLNYRTLIGNAVERLVQSGKVEVRTGMSSLRQISDIASDYEDNEFANLLFHFVVDHADEVPTENATDMYKWIVNWSDPESETHKKFKQLIPEPKHRGRPRSKKAEV